MLDNAFVCVLVFVSDVICYVNCTSLSSLYSYRVIEMNNNSPPLTFKRFQTIVSRLELPRRPLPPITQQQMDKCRTKIADNHDQLYSIPSLEELGTHDWCDYIFRIEYDRSPNADEHNNMLFIC